MPGDTAKSLSSCVDVGVVDEFDVQPMHSTSDKPCSEALQSEGSANFGFENRRKCRLTL